jgi:molybdopterin/thiamine biosynthesis adenylyltransferase
MTNDRFDRQVRFFGREGQERLAAARVAIIGVGGLGSHVVQQLALLGVGAIVPVDGQELDLTNRNRLVGASEDDPIPGTRKVDIAERSAKAIDSSIVVDKVFDSLVSDGGFAAVIGADYVFGCLDSEGTRLVLTELCAAYEKPYIDVSSDILPAVPPEYGGQVCIAWSGDGCLSCLNVLDRAEAEAELAGPEERRRRAEIYGVPRDLLNEAGPSVVSINGVVASLAVTEFMLAVTGQRTPNRYLTYEGRTGKVRVSTDEPTPGCYYCKGLRGTRDRADVARYIREGVGAFLR